MARYGATGAAWMTSWVAEEWTGDRNAYFLFKHLRNAQLVLYPDSGHGALFSIQIVSSITSGSS